VRLERVTAFIFGLGALALLGGLYAYGRKVRDDRGDEDAGVTTPLEETLQTATGARVLNRERALGVDSRLTAFLDWWNDNGPHVVRVAGGVFGGHRYVGGVRDLSQQLDDFRAGLSKADGPNTAPHMHAGALDLWPESFVPNRSFDEQPVPDDYVAKFKAQADAAREHGLTAGFYWPHPDMPHVEVPDWRRLPVVPLVTNG
jgi:hypothetical protein